MSSCKSPINYFGGKARMADDIVKTFPPHKIYVEPFGGSGAVLFAKPPSSIEIYNDVDAELVNLFMVLRDKELSAELECQLELTCYSRTEFALAKTPSGNPVERARRLMVRQRQSFGAHGSNWAFSANDVVGNLPNVVSRWRKGIERLPMALKRLARVQIECKSWEELIPRLDHKEALFYLDPPYVADTRIDGGYDNEMDSQAHVALVKLLLNLKGMAVVSGYDTPLYTPLTKAGWVQQTCEGVSFSSDTRAIRTEVLWLSPKVADFVKGNASRQMSFMELL